MTNITLTKLMTGTALAVALAASPALAQTTAPETEAPAAQDTAPSTTDEAPAATESPAMDSDSGDTMTAPTDSVEAPSATDDLGEDTAAAVDDLPTEPILTMLEEDQMTSREVIGMDVRNAEDESIGTIDALVIDGEDRVIGGIVSVGGFLGLGAKDVAVNWQEFTFNPEEEIASVTLTREALEDAPAFEDRDDLTAEAETDANQGMAPTAPTAPATPTE